MPEPRKIMMAVDDAGAVRQMEVEALRHINDALTALTSDMRDARERLIRIESNQLDRTVQSHAARIEALEKKDDQRDGAASVVGAILKSPAIGWLVGAALAVLAYLQGKHA